MLDIHLIMLGHDWQKITPHWKLLWFLNTTFFFKGIKIGSFILMLDINLIMLGHDCPKSHKVYTPLKIALVSKYDEFF